MRARKDRLNTRTYMSLSASRTPSRKAAFVPPEEDVEKREVGPCRRDQEREGARGRHEAEVDRRSATARSSDGYRRQPEVQEDGIVRMRQQHDGGGRRHEGGPPGIRALAHLDLRPEGQEHHPVGERGRVGEQIEEDVGVEEGAEEPRIGAPDEQREEQRPEPGVAASHETVDHSFQEHEKEEQIPKADKGEGRRGLHPGEAGEEADGQQIGREEHVGRGGKGQLRMMRAPRVKGELPRHGRVLPDVEQRSPPPLQRHARGQGEQDE